MTSPLRAPPLARLAATSLAIGAGARSSRCWSCCRSRRWSPASRSFERPRPRRTCSTSADGSSGPARHGRHGRGAAAIPAGRQRRRADGPGSGANRARGRATGGTSERCAWTGSRSGILSISPPVGRHWDPTEAAVSEPVMDLANVALGGTVVLDGYGPMTVVGLVENPMNLDERTVVVDPASVTVDPSTARRMARRPPRWRGSRGDR